MSIRTIQDIASDISTQDNRCTAHPYVIVEQKRIDYGFDPQWFDNDCIAWIDENSELICRDYWKDITKAEQEGNSRIVVGDPADDMVFNLKEITKTAFVERWEFVQAFLTIKGAEHYIELNGHNLKEPRIYVESAHRNHKIQILREYLKKVHEAHTE